MFAGAVEEIAKLKADGKIVDLLQWRGHRSDPVGMADDGYVLEYRLFDAGKNMFASNADKATHAPKYMWDEKKMGFKSITADSQARRGKLFLMREQNAVPFDPAAGWKEGDMVPDYLTVARLSALQTSQPGQFRSCDRDVTIWCCHLCFFSKSSNFLAASKSEPIRQWRRCRAARQQSAG